MPFVAASAIASARAQGDVAGACTASTDGPELTIAHCTRALEVPALGAATRAACLERRGLARFAQRDLARAGEDLDGAIRADARSHSAHNSRAIVWMQAGDVDAALADYDAAIRLKPDYAYALSNRGHARLVKGDTAGARADLDRALALMPAHRELALVGRGRLWLVLGDCDRALADFDAALASNAAYANAVSGRGYAHVCSGDFGAAAEDFGREWRLRPDADSAVSWIIARRRGGRDASDALAAVERGGDPRRGMPVGLALFAGRLSAEQAERAIPDRDPAVERARRCSVGFQLGEWYLIGQDAARARRHLGAAVAACDRSQAEYAAAVTELARAGAP